MERLNTDQVTNLWRYLDEESLTALKTVSKSVATSMDTATNLNYLQKEKLDKYLGKELPFVSLDWEDVYNFVTFVLENSPKNVLFTRDETSAQIGLLLGLDPTLPLLNNVKINRDLILIVIDTNEHKRDLKEMYKSLCRSCYLNTLGRVSLVQRSSNDTDTNHVVRLLLEKGYIELVKLLGDSNTYAVLWIQSMIH